MPRLGGRCGVTDVRLEIVVEGHSDQKFFLVVPHELWEEVEAHVAQLAEQGDIRTTEQVIADVLGVGLSMTHGVG